MPTHCIVFLLRKNINASDADDSPTFFFSPITIISSPRTIYHRIPSSLISMHKLCFLPPSSPRKSSFFFLSLLSIWLRLSALLHPPSKYLWLLPLAELGSLAKALRSQRYADWHFPFFFCKAVFEQAGRWVNLIKARCGPEEEKIVAGMTLSHTLMPVCVQTSTEDASRGCRRTVLIFSTGKHGTHLEAEMQQLWQLHSQDWKWSWWKEKLSELVVMSSRS